MTNDNETFEQLCAEMRSFGDVPPPRFAWCDLAERAEAAHERELVVKNAEIARLKEMVDNCLKALGYCKAREVANG